MKLDIGLAAKLMEVPAAARTAEENGFDALWSAETGHDPFLPLLLAAEHTERIKLGTAIAVAEEMYHQNREPAWIKHTNEIRVPEGCEERKSEERNTLI